MRKTYAAIFAHPDDEAFGPAGTLATLAKENDVHLICATRGDNGQNHSSSTKHLSDIRAEELQKSARILGIKNIVFFNYKDGSLCNNLYHQLAGEIETQLNIWQPHTLITFEPRGISGHIDHIAVSMITSYVFNRRSYTKELWYYCLDVRCRNELKNYFIYFPPGYERSQVDTIIDVTPVWDSKLLAIHQHTSQKKDIEKIIPVLNKYPKEEYFLVQKK